MLLNVHPSGICHFYPPLPPCPTPQQLWFIKLWLQYVRLSASWRVETSADQEDQLKVAMCQDQLQCLKTSLHTTCDKCAAKYTCCKTLSMKAYLIFIVICEYVLKLWVC